MVLSAIKANDPESFSHSGRGYRSALAPEIFGGPAAVRPCGLCAASILWKTPLSGRVLRARSLGQPALRRTIHWTAAAYRCADARRDPFNVGSRSAPRRRHRRHCRQRCVNWSLTPDPPSGAWIASVRVSIVVFVSGTGDTAFGVSMASAALATK